MHDAAPQKYIKVIPFSTIRDQREFFLSFCFFLFFFSSKVRQHTCSDEPDFSVKKHPRTSNGQSSCFFLFLLLLCHTLHRACMLPTFLSIYKRRLRTFDADLIRKPYVQKYKGWVIPITNESLCLVPFSILCIVYFV